MNKAHIAAALLIGTSLLIGGCDRIKQATGVGKSEATVAETAYPERVFFGDTHLHTSNSVDAFGFGVRLGPEEALRFARGEEVKSTTGTMAKLERPLDFLVITDHAEGLGGTKALFDAPRILLTDPQMRRWYDMMHESPQQSQQAMMEILNARANNKLPQAMLEAMRDDSRTKTIWNANIDTVERYNEPGKFTAFFGFEYTLMPGGNNLHRNIIFRDGPDKVRTVVPLDPTSEATPDKIWDYMEAYEKATSGRVLSIPHNSNVSNGLMFQLTQPDGGPMTAEYARRRARLEPVVEITQIKGDSEAHPFLSPNDEFAGFGVEGWELANLLGSEMKTPDMFAGEYVREALKRGLAIEQQTGVNPYKFGVIGSTDSHTALSTGDENNFFGKHTGNEPSPTRLMGSQSLGSNKSRFNWHFLAGGYAAVWATANSRTAIWDALARREVYATTGPRMTVRVFGGWDFKAEDLKGDWVKAGYARGVPMGGELAADGKGAPSFLISALKDPIGANLDRVQVVKGWVDAAGKSHEQVFDVVWSDMDKRRAVGGKVPAVGDTVDLATASYQNTIGAGTLATVWRDPAFDPKLRSFYYVRVIEIPTPSWPAYDAVRFKVKLAPEVRVKQQERAYTSAIWYTPAA
jgi:hypothetical protein